MSLNRATQLCNHLNTKNIKPLSFKVRQILRCNLSDIENVFVSGALPSEANGYLSISINGIWQCIVLQTNGMILIVYTAGHQSPMYISVVSELAPISSHTKMPLQ